MIAAEVFVALGLAPRDAHRGDQAALIELILVRLQDAAAQAVEAAAVARVADKLVIFIVLMAHPRPLVDEAGEALRKWPDERLCHRRDCAGEAAAETHRDEKPAITVRLDLAGECHISIRGMLKKPLHFTVAEDVLIAVAGADVARRGAAKWRRCSAGQVAILAPSVKDRAAT